MEPLAIIEPLSSSNKDAVIETLIYTSRYFGDDCLAGFEDLKKLQVEFNGVLKRQKFDDATRI